MIKDARGLPVTTADSGEAVGAIDQFVARLLRLDAGVETVAAAADRFPGVPLLQVYAASLFLFGQTTANSATAARYLAAAEKAIAGATPRETALLGAVRVWHEGRYLDAVARFEEITAQFPRDLCAAKMCEFLYYVLGQHHFGARFRRHMGWLRDANEADPDYLGMAAFAHELCGDFDEAERLSEKALAIEARNPWAHHALSHVLIRQGRIGEGKARLEGFLPSLETCGRVAQCHDAWHLALLYLEELDFGSAERLFHSHIWSATPDYVTVQLDAIALLWRMELAGRQMDEQWDEQWQSIADRVAPLATELFMPFINAHYAYALGRAGRTAELAALRGAVAARAEAGDEEAKRLWAPVGRPVVEAVADFALGRRGAAAERLDPVMRSMTMVGGSDAQTDLFRQTYLAGLQAGGRRSEAGAYFGRISEGKRLTPLDHLLAAGGG